MQLTAFFREHPKVAIAFSGGTDSSFLLYAAKRDAKEVRAYYVQTAFQPRFETEEALRTAEMIGVPVSVLSVDVLADSFVTSNPSNRCYFCKKRLFGAIREKAESGGFPTLLDGTNASDDAGDRPGMKALEELSVISPLRLCGLTKDAIRSLSKEAGLPTWNKPAYSCLATRIPAGELITAEKLRTTETAESFLLSLGFSDFRVRFLGGAARIQIREEQIPLFMENREKILAKLKREYSAVLLDLEVRPR
ncbi:MAG: ATP-dependent sacrificial sulfur transferase LarE [Clostridia bacterium]|nr:ATP-dependent sacrificial sulfur transferase LarE [Clostridia bacterium]